MRGVEREPEMLSITTWLAAYGTGVKFKSTAILKHLLNSLKKNQTGAIPKWPAAIALLCALRTRDLADGSMGSPMAPRLLATEGTYCRRGQCLLKSIRIQESRP